MIAVDLERLAAAEGMQVRDIRDDAPDLPDGVRVIAMDEGGTILPWQWAERVDWWRVIAWRTEDDGTRFVRCDCCGENTAAAGDETAICEGCSEHGDREPDGDAEADEASA